MYQSSIVLNNDLHVLQDHQCLSLQLANRAYDDFDALLKALDQLFEPRRAAITTIGSIEHPLQYKFEDFDKE